MRKGTFALLLLLSAACSDPVAPSGNEVPAQNAEPATPSAERAIVTRDSTRTTAHSVVYGDDDRLDFFEHPDAELRSLTERSIAAMVSNRAIEIDGDEAILRARTLGEDYALCEGERFYDQPTLAGCSGTLIDDDLILTAGHCVESGCDRVSWVFNYLYESPGELRNIVAADVFACQRVIVESTPSFMNTVPDYAIVQLDRPATPRFAPVEVHAERWPVSVDEPVAIIGFGSGLPAKIDDGGFVTNERRNVGDYFQATTDAFGGNSGSGVFNDDNIVVGILVAGEQDYDYSAGCGRVAYLPEEGVGGESVTYAYLPVEELCASGWPSVRLCDTQAECGNGLCELGESEVDCPADCEEAGGGDWLCDPAFFNSGDGCDCECGVFDPDCLDDSLETYNCRSGEFCNGAGLCQAEAPTEVPEAWRCDPNVYGARDGCDCECGAYDPDCDIPGSLVYNCIEGDTCTERALCSSSEPLPDPTPDAGTPDTTPDAGTGDVPADDASGDDTNSQDTTPGGFGGYIPSQGCTASKGAHAPWWLLALGGTALVRKRRRSA